MKNSRLLFLLIWCLCHSDTLQRTFTEEFLDRSCCFCYAIITYLEFIVYDMKYYLMMRLTVEQLGLIGIESISFCKVRAKNCVANNMYDWLNHNWLQTLVPMVLIDGLLSKYLRRWNVKCWEIEKRQKNEIEKNPK